MATKTSKKADNSAIDTIKAKATEINNNLLQFTDELVDETLVTGEQWQKLFSKTLKKSTTLFGQQQDIIFNGLEKLMDQYSTGNKRFKTLFSVKPIDAKKPVTPAPKTSKPKGVKVEKKAAVKKATKTKTATTKAISNTFAAKSDLKIIEGVGPKIEELLNNAGILNFDQLKTAKVEDLKKILDDAGSRYRMHDPSTWSKQAELAAAGKIEELNVLQAELKGGK